MHLQNTLLKTLKKKKKSWNKIHGIASNIYSLSVDCFKCLNIQKTKSGQFNFLICISSAKYGKWCGNKKNLKIYKKIFDLFKKIKVNCQVLEKLFPFKLIV